MVRGSSCSKSMRTSTRLSMYPHPSSRGAKRRGDLNIIMVLIVAEGDEPLPYNCKMSFVERLHILCRRSGCAVQPDVRSFDFRRLYLPIFVMSGSKEEPDLRATKKTNPDPIRNFIPSSRGAKRRGDLIADIVILSNATVCVPLREGSAC